MVCRAVSASVPTRLALQEIGAQPSDDGDTVEAATRLESSLNGIRALVLSREKLHVMDRMIL